MTDELPPLHVTRRPGSAPRPEVLAAVVHEGRRRVRRSALWSAGTALAVIGVFTLGFGSGGNEALVLIPASPAPGVVRTPTIAPPPQPSPSRPPSAGVAVGAPASAVPLGPPTGPAVADARPTATPVPTPARRLPAYRESPVASGSADLCRGAILRDTPPGYRVCAESSSSSGAEVTSGSTVTFNLDLCNSTTSPGDFALSFAGGREHDVVIRSIATTDDLWTWSLHHEFPQGRHTQSVPRGSCLSWRTPWDTRDDTGKPVPAGEYDVVSSVEVNGRTQTVHYRLTVTSA